MKKIGLIGLLALCFKLSAFAQEWVFDPQYLISVQSNQAVRMSAEQTHNQYLSKIKDNIDAVNTNASFVVLAQAMIYNGLSNVNSALKDGLEVKNMATVSSDIVGYMDQCLQLARSDPALLVFASKMQAEMQQRVIALTTDVSGFVMKEGSNVLADYNSRDQLLRRITQQLQIIDGLAYGAWRAMYWASQRGVLASLNPFAAYINRDKLFVERIIQNAKYLKQ